MRTSQQYNQHVLVTDSICLAGKQLQMHEMLLNAWSWGCVGVRSGAVRGRGLEQNGGAPGLYDAPPLGMLSRYVLAMHMPSQDVGAKPMTCMWCQTTFSAVASDDKLYLKCYANWLAAFGICIRCLDSLSFCLKSDQMLWNILFQVDDMPLAPP